jgi:hypothetical protein
MKSRKKRTWKICVLLYCRRFLAGRTNMSYICVKHRFLRKVVWTAEVWWMMDAAVWCQLEPLGCPETSVTCFQSTPRNIPKEWRPQLHRGGSLKSGLWLEGSFTYRGRARNTNLVHFGWKMTFLNREVHICYLLDGENPLNSFTNYFSWYKYVGFAKSGETFIIIFPKPACLTQWVFFVRPQDLV